MDGLRGSQERQVYKIRQAIPEDFHTILPMAKKFHASTDYALLSEFDVGSALETFINALEHGVVVVVEKDEVVVGFALGAFMPLPSNYNDILFTEMYVWLEEEHRGTSAFHKLKGEMEDQARLRGASLFAMGAHSQSPPSLGRMYEKRGYVPIERVYMRKL